MNKYNISSRNEYDSIYLESINNPEEFWSEIASNNFIWKKKWDKVYFRDKIIVKGEKDPHTYFYIIKFPQGNEVIWNQLSI